MPLSPKISTWPIIISASAVLMITMGARQSSGLYVLLLNTATGLGIVSIGFALAVGRFIFAPLAQAVIGAIGWVTAMRSPAAAALFTIPLAWPLRGGPTSIQASTANPSRTTLTFYIFADISLASLASLVDLPIREAKPIRSLINPPKKGRTHHVEHRMV